MRRQGWRAFCMSAFVMWLTHQPVLAQQQEDIGQLRQQMAEQRRLMEVME